MSIIILPIADEELMRECHTTACRASGKGGQHVNTTDSAVRLTHLPTGLVVTSQKEKSQYLNKQHCLKKLRLKVAALNYRAPPRVLTRKPKRADLKRLFQKKKSSQTKQLRRRPQSEE